MQWVGLLALVAAVASALVAMQLPCSLYPIPLQVGPGTTRPQYGLGVAPMPLVVALCWTAVIGSILVPHTFSCLLQVAPDHRQCLPEFAGGLRVRNPAPGVCSCIQCSRFQSVRHAPTRTPGVSLRTEQLSSRHLSRRSFSVQHGRSVCFTARGLSFASLATSCPPPRNGRPAAP